VRGRDAVVWDRWIAALFAGAAFDPPLAAIGPQYGDLPGRPPDAFAVVLVLAQTVPLAVRRTRPAVCLAVIGTSFAVYMAHGYPIQFGGVGLYLALYSVGAHQVRFRRGLAATAAAGYAVFTAVLHVLGTPDRLPDFVVYFLGVSSFWILGGFVRRHRAEEAQRRRLVADTAAAAERARIARELHDVVTHHVTAIVVQADATRFRTSSPDHVDRALTAIGGNGRRALTELRELLDVLEATGDPHGDPAAGTVRDLVERTRLGGQPVELIEDGERAALPAGVDMVVYRVVQEALTNAVKYATGKPTEVRVGRRCGRVEVEVTTLGSAAAPAVLSVGAGGRGLAGMGERVGELGGELTAGEQPDGRFRVHALIPVGSDS
jgi:signal transduction histidine kinase